LMLPRLVLKEIKHRWQNSLLTASAIVAAVAVFVMLLTMGRALERETAQIVRDLGFNILILPKGADLSKFWIEGYTDEDMPEEYVRRLAETSGVYADHFVALLQKRIEWKGERVLLVGWLPEIRALEFAWKRKRPMGFRIPQGVAYVGYDIARRLGIKEGDTIELLGKRLKVARCLPEMGTREDVSIIAHLHDVQEMLGKRGRINLIKALNCICHGATMDMTLKRIEEALPGVKAIPLLPIAKARLEARRTVEGWVAVVLPVVLVVCAAWVGILALMNVQERREEIGILRALGFSSSRIALLFLGRAFLLGLLGAALGFALGTWLALHFGPGLFKITAAKIKPSYSLLLWALLGAPLVAVISSLIPTAVAVTQDPAEVLRRG